MRLDVVDLIVNRSSRSLRFRWWWDVPPRFAAKILREWKPHCSLRVDLGHHGMRLLPRSASVRALLPFAIFLIAALALLVGIRVGEREPEAPEARLQDPGSLVDVRGSSRRIAEFLGDRGLVVCFLGVDCAVANLYAADVKRLDKEYASRGLGVIAVYPNAGEQLDEIAAHALEHDFALPVLKDRDQALADAVGAERTPTFCLMDGRRTVRYVGPFDDRFGVGHRRERSTSDDLSQAIERMLSSEGIQGIERTPVDGCLIERAVPSETVERVTYDDDVAAIFDRRCVTCHQVGQSAPFSLTGFENAFRWRSMIREVVAERRMPPWHADGRYGTFLNDRSLDDDERAMVLAWVDQGGWRNLDQSRRPRVPLVEIDRRRRRRGKSTPGWLMGEPDAEIVSPQAFEVPAQGVVSYKYAWVPREETDAIFDQERWVRIAEVLPEKPSVVHHITVFFTEAGETLEKGALTLGNILGAWAPGEPRFAFPDDTAMRVPRGARLVFEIHYTTNGSVTTDRPRMALQFADTPPEYEVQLVTHFHPTLRIPAGAAHFRADFESEFAQDAELIGLLPHMHLRGKAYQFEARYPNGETETLLSVPRFDFFWQTLYWFEEPIPMPQGTQIRSIGYWDNSEYNASNPDPDVEVRHGAQSWDEMMVSWLFFKTRREDASGADALTYVGSPTAEAAAQQWGDAVEEDPEDLAARFELAAAFTSLGQVDEAIEQYRSIVSRDPRSVRARRELGALLLELGDANGAAEQLQRVTEARPNHVEAAINLTTALLRTERRGVALEAARRAVTLAPDRYETQNNLAVALIETGDSVAAEAALRTAIEIEPDAAMAHRTLGLVHAMRGEHATAIEAFETATRSDPEDFESWMYLGMAQDAVGESRNAADAYRQVLHVAPDHEGAINNLAWCLATADDDTLRDGVEAVSLAERICTPETDDAGKLDTLAAAYAAAERFDEAVETIDRAIRSAKQSNASGESLDAMETRRALYAAGEPYRATPSSSVNERTLQD